MMCGDRQAVTPAQEACTRLLIMLRAAIKCRHMYLQLHCAPRPLRARNATIRRVISVQMRRGRARGLTGVTIWTSRQRYIDQNLAETELVKLSNVRHLGGTELTRAFCLQRFTAIGPVLNPPRPCQHSNYSGS